MQGDSAFAGGAWQTNSGTYYDFLLTVNGCDSIITTVISIITSTQHNAFTSVLIYPNPFHDHLMMDAQAIYEREYYVVINSMGEIVLKGKVNITKTIIKTSGLSPGVYFLMMNDKRYKLLKM